MRASRFVLIFLLSLSGFAQSPKAAAPETWQKELLQWREKYTQSLRAKDGWLSVVGLSWLNPGDNTVGADPASQIKLPANSAPRFGVVHFDGATLLLQPPPGGFPRELSVNGNHPLKPVPLFADLDSTPSKITLGTLSIEIIHRGDRYGVRTRDSAAPARLNFHGLHWYAPDPKYHILAKWIPYATPQTRSIPTIIGTDAPMSAPGVAEFTLDGQTLKLEPVLEKSDDQQLFFILRDTTSKTETYGAGRFLYSSLPSNGLGKAGELWLDFNRLHNPPCAFTPYATCPLPLPSNRLQLAIPAGEKRYHD
jgi:uncharacterized protein (DUF1684 family)